MPSTMNMTFLALATTAAAIPHYGGHAKFHSGLKPSGYAGHGTGKAYPTGGWPGVYNTTALYPTGTAYDDGKTTTLEETSTSTVTIVKTIYSTPSPAADDAEEATKEAAPTAEDKCGPATITVTAAEKVTITVTPTLPPSSSAVALESKSEGYVDNTSSTSEFVIASSYAAVETPASSKAEEYTPTVPTPEPATSSKAEGYPVVSLVQKEPVSESSVVASPSPSATSASSGSSPGYSGTKRGLAYNDANLCKSLGGSYGFAYNWGSVENNDVGAPYVPMMHRPSLATPEEWLANVDKACEKGTKAVMGFNEPDHAEQANLTPEAACSAWKQYMNPIASSHPDVTIIGPSVTNGGAPMGLDWLSRFHKTCPDAIVHATNIHFYDIYEEATIDRFKAQVEKAAAEYGKPVWVTEFGLNPGSATQEQAASFLKECMEYLDNSDKVQGYSWFMVGTGENQLNTANGLSALGQAYSS